jgi:alpha-glucuronidase
VLDADTRVSGPGSTVARVIDGSIHRYALTGIAGVANVGSDRNWTGSHFNQANWYVYGRLAWDPGLGSATIADEWIRQTLSSDPDVVQRVKAMMMGSREALVNYMTPLGLHHIMARNHHYGPGPWVAGGRADWTSIYYHRADTVAVGFDRTATGSDAVAQYAPPVRARFASRATVPDELLLWFHRVRWGERLRSGRTLWHELVHRYSAGVDSARGLHSSWKQLDGRVDGARYRAIDEYLAIQAKEAKWWRDASLMYFQTFSRQPLPPGYEPADHSLEFYQRLTCPADVTRPRCPGI